MWSRYAKFIVNSDQWKCRKNELNKKWTMLNLQKEKKKNPQKSKITDMHTWNILNIYNLSIKLVVRGIWLSCGNELINIRIGFWLLFFFLLFLFIFLCNSVLMFTLLLLLRCQNDISARPKNWFGHFCQSNGRIVELVHVTASLCTNKTCELCTSVFA